MEWIKVAAVSLEAGDTVLVGFTPRTVESVIADPAGRGVAIKLAGHFQEIIKDWSDWMTKLPAPELEPAPIW